MVQRLGMAWHIGLDTSSLALFTMMVSSRNSSEVDVTFGLGDLNAGWHEMTSWVTK